MTTRIIKHPFPNRPILLVEAGAVRWLYNTDITRNSVGQKAFGIASLPDVWTPAFFVVSAACSSSALGCEFLADNLPDIIGKLDIEQNASFIVRSSGSRETLEKRGQLESRVCDGEAIVDTLAELQRRLPEEMDGEVHWIVQRKIAGKSSGHMSNVRRSRKDPRDWLIEFEGDKQPGYATGIAVRRWRREGFDTWHRLRCPSEAAIPTVLRPVASWATAFHDRMLLEWVFDGAAAWIVQADIEENTTDASDPHKILKRALSDIGNHHLKAFKPVTSDDYSSFCKLRNASRYASLGYSMPTFYVLNDKLVLKSICSGIIPDDLRDDLKELTKRPLILRTDVRDQEIEMLPRSDELRSLESAERWLSESFAKGIESKELDVSVCGLIAHHFIPSVASAWARAEPNGRNVRIEALWGIPEGLYWFSHDVYEVSMSGSAFRERIRYKGTYVASDEKGQWVTMKTALPHEWGKVISVKRRLIEIAANTQKLANIEKYPVSVMWFVGNHPQATSHEVLPWYHSKSELKELPRAAPLSKRRGMVPFTIEDDDSWLEFQRQIASGKVIERTIVLPKEASLLRNDQFITSLSQLARRHNTVIELKGGILSHAYYKLKHEGVEVECVDLFGIVDDVVEYDKLVRDKIPEQIKQGGEKARIVTLQGEALVLELRRKLTEEAFEVMDANPGELLGELADVLEVVLSLGKVLGLSVKEIERARKQKCEKRGGFTKGLMLLSTVTPHVSTVASVKSDDFDESFDFGGTIDAILRDQKDLIERNVIKRPDLRRTLDGIEKVYAFETSLPHVDGQRIEHSFKLPVGKGTSQPFTLVIESKREGALLRQTLKLRLYSEQLEMDLLF